MQKMVAQYRAETTFLQSYQLLFQLQLPVASICSEAAEIDVCRNGHWLFWDNSC